jgi:hypothetical protein
MPFIYKPSNTITIYIIIHIIVHNPNYTFTPALSKQIMYQSNAGLYPQFSWDPHSCISPDFMRVVAINFW